MAILTSFFDGVDILFVEFGHLIQSDDFIRSTQVQKNINQYSRSVYSHGDNYTKRKREYNFETSYNPASFALL